jgi:two-component system sensor histidine kinase UhpB
VRVFALNAAVLLVAFALLVFTPVTLSAHTTQEQFIILAVGLIAMLMANALLLRVSLAPLRHLSEAMHSVDILAPGARLEPTGTPEVASVIDTFNATIDRLEAERRSSMRRVLTAQESERRRIAQELHDEIGQNLTAVVLELTRVRERIHDESDALADAQELARESLDELGRISYRLRPAALDDLGLASALAALCSGIARRTGVGVRCEVDGELPAVDPQVELALYRIVQEALTNAVRHAECSSVDVAVAHSDGEIRVRVADDGAGLVGAKPGAGMRGMRERALVIGGSLDVRSHPGEGVEVLVRVPVADAVP